MGFFTKDGIDTPLSVKLRNLTKELKDKEVRVGFNADSGSYNGEKKKGVKKRKNESGVSVVMVAAWNEYGTEHSPSRPFMRNTVRNGKDKIINHATNAVKRVIRGDGDASVLLNSVGAHTKGLMQQEIRNGEFAPNAPSTIAKKGSSKPLIDTGRMRQSVVYVIKQKGE